MLPLHCDGHDRARLQSRVDNTTRMRMCVGHDETKYLSHNNCANV